jgi:predicted nucleic acid-binding protein
MIVVDASVVLEVLLRTQAAASLEERLLAPAETPYAPDLIDLEVVQVLRRYAAAGQADAARCREALADLSDFPLTRYPHDFLVPRIWDLRASLTAYDAAYVALARGARRAARHARYAVSGRAGPCGYRRIGVSGCGRCG